MQVYRVPISSLRAEPDNARSHRAENLESIKQSLIEFGQQYPIVVERPDIVRKGSGTLAAAAELGWTEVYVVYTDLVGPRAKAYSVKDNATSDSSSFDPELYAAALGDLAESGIDLDSLGLEREDPAVVNAREPDVEVSEPRIKAYSQMPPPEMAWALIGIPIVRYGEIQSAVVAIARIPGVLCETSVNAGPKVQESLGPK